MTNLYGQLEFSSTYVLKLNNFCRYSAEEIDLGVDAASVDWEGLWKLGCFYSPRKRVYPI